MNDPTFNCPHCGGTIKLTETLAAPLLDAARKRFDEDSRARDAALAKREAAIRDAQAGVEKARADVDAMVASRLVAERETIARDEARKAAEGASRQVEALRQESARKDAALAEAQRAEAEAKKAAQDAQKAELAIRRERQQLIEEKEQFELEKQRAIDAERGKIRDAALREAQDQHRLKDAEREKVISDLKVQLDEMRRRAEQGSQQLQGEVQELDFEATLRAAFPHDLIEPVAKGQFGGDVLQRVVGSGQNVVGTILWECKRTKNWSDLWLAKLKGDQREAKAEVAVILTSAMPKGVENFGEMEGVWVTNAACALPLVTALRAALKEVALARSASEGQQTKMELVYHYLTGAGFRRRVEAIKDAFEIMLTDLESEKRVIQKQWAKREVQIRAVIDNTIGLYGELQGIAGRAMPEIDGLELKALESGEE